MNFYRFIWLRKLFLHVSTHTYNRSAGKQKTGRLGSRSTIRKDKKYVLTSKCRETVLVKCQICKQSHWNCHVVHWNISSLKGNVWGKKKQHENQNTFKWSKANNPIPSCVKPVVSWSHNTQLCPSASKTIFLFLACQETWRLCIPFFLLHYLKILQIQSDKSVAYHPQEVENFWGKK